MARRHRSIVLAFVLVAGLLGVVPPAVAAPGPDADPRNGPPAFVPRRALVGATADRAATRRTIRAHGGRIESYYEPGNLFVVRTPGKVPAFVDALRGRPGVRYAEPDAIVHALDVVPNDPRWSSQWDMQQISMPAAWEIGTGSDDVVVGVIDTGVDYRHPDLAGQMWRNPGETGTDALGRDKATNGLDDDGNGFVDDVHGADFVSNDGDPFDDNQHGTHVTGTIAAAGNDGIGIAGINWDVGVMALKFLDASGSGSELNAVRAIDYAIAKGALLTNNSWGGTAYSQALREAIGRARAANQLFVAAAGNSGVSTDAWPFYPAGYEADNIVAVAATDQKDSLASFSNRGAYSVDLAAPGVGIWSTTPDGGYASFNGTSMAAPHVSGALALLFATEPALRTAGFEAALHRLYASVDAVAGLSGKIATGGRLNVARLVTPDAVPPAACSLSVTATGRTSVSLSWTASGDDGSAGSAATQALAYRPAGDATWAAAPAPAPADAGTSQAQVVRGLPPVTELDFRLTVADDGGNSTACTTTASTEPGVTIFGDDFETPSFTASTWSASSGSWSSAAEAAHRGAAGMSDSPSRNYRDFVSVGLWTTDGFSLVGALAPRLAFWHRYSIEPGYDSAIVQVSTDGGSTWANLTTFTGHVRGWAPEEIPLAAYAGQPNVRLRFVTKADLFVNYDGWWLDDIRVTGDPADAIPPAAPTGLAATDPGTGGTVHLDWDDNTESDLAGYHVLRRSGGDWTQLTTNVVTRSDFDDTTATDGTSYTYAVLAVDTSGNVSEPSNEASATPSDVTPPAAPTGLTASGEDGFVPLDWNDNTERDLSSYRVYRRTGGEAWTSVDVGATSAYTDTDVVNDVTYEYRVTAVDATGNESEPSATVSATPHHPVVGSWAPDGVFLMKGTKFGDPVSNLAEDDELDFRIGSYKLSAYNTDWYAYAAIPVTGIQELTITYDGSYSGSVTQRLYLYDYPKRQWVQLDKRTIGTADVTIAFTTTQISRFISAAGGVRLRVLGQATSAFTAQGDLVRFTVVH